MKKGFTQIELLLVVGLMAILLSMGGVFFSNFVRQDQVQSEAEKVRNVIQEAQTRTVSGYTLGGGSSLNFGIYFASDHFVLFPGTVYDDHDSRNQQFFLPEELRFDPVLLPENSLLFQKISGEIIGFDPEQNSVTLIDRRSSNAIKISFNSLGVVFFSAP